MLKVDVKTIDVEAYDCFYSALCTVFHSLGYDYQMSCLGYWAFKYDSLAKRESKCIGAGIDPYEKRHIEGAQEFQGLGLHVIYSRQDEIGSIEAAIKEILKKGKPAVVVGDSYHCTWSTYYKFIRYKHCYLIYGWDEETGKYSVLDPYMTNQRVEATFEELELEDSCKYILEVIKFEAPLKFSECKKALQDDIQYCIEEDTLGQLRTMREDIEKHLSIVDETGKEENEKLLAPIFENIRVLIRNRTGYQLMLKYLIENRGLDLKESQEKALYVIKIWRKLRYGLFRFALYDSKKDIRKETLKVFDILYKAEEEFLELYSKQVAALKMD